MRSAQTMPPDGLIPPSGQVGWDGSGATAQRWATAYQRYRLWCATGTWPRILAKLAPSQSEDSLSGSFLRRGDRRPRSAEESGSDRPRSRGLSYPMATAPPLSSGSSRCRSSRSGSICRCTPARPWSRWSTCSAPSPNHSRRRSRCTRSPSGNSPKNRADHSHRALGRPTPRWHRPPLRRHRTAAPGHSDSTTPGPRTSHPHTAAPRGSTRREPRMIR